MDVLVATDFFTAEVWTLGGLVTYYVLFFIHLGSRRVQVARVTPIPPMKRGWSRWLATSPWRSGASSSPGQYLIHDRDGKYCPAFQHIIEAAGVTRVPLPPRPPNLNAYAERWVRSVKEECLSRLILFGEDVHLGHALHRVCGALSSRAQPSGQGEMSCSFLRQEADERRTGEFRGSSGSASF